MLEEWVETRGVPQHPLRDQTSRHWHIGRARKHTILTDAGRDVYDSHARLTERRVRRQCLPTGWHGGRRFANAYARRWHTTEERVVQGKYISGEITFIPLPEEKRGQFRLRQYASDTPRERGGVHEHRTALMYGYYVESADGTTLAMQGVEREQNFSVVILATEPEQSTFPQFLTLKGLWSSDRDEPVRLEREMFPPQIAVTVVNFNACVEANKRKQ